MDIKELKPTALDNYSYIIDTRGKIFGIAKDAGRENAKYYMIYDRVKLTPDDNGIICSGIKTATNKACIADIVRNDTGCWLYIVCENGEKGYCKPDRVKVAESSEYVALVAAGLIKHNRSACAS